MLKEMIDEQTRLPVPVIIRSAKEMAESSTRIRF